MLGEEDFQRATEFIEKHARPLDKSVFDFEFRDGKIDKIVNELENYQNDDGGFGYGLEPDIQSNNSSVLATTIALQHINDLSIDSTTMMTKIFDYLEKEYRYEKEIPFFPIVTPGISDMPHAPWWTVEKIKPPELGSWSNPNIEIFANMQKYQKYQNKEIMNRMKYFIEENLEVLFPDDELNYYHYFCWKRALPHISDDWQSHIFDSIRKIKQKTSDIFSIEKIDHIPPYSFVTEKSSFLFQEYPDEFLTLFKHQIEEQQEDGGWYPKWTWGSQQLPEKVKFDWAGKITTEFLTTLKYCELLDWM